MKTSLLRQTIKDLSEELSVSFDSSGGYIYTAIKENIKIELWSDHDYKEIMMSRQKASVVLWAQHIDSDLKANKSPVYLAVRSPLIKSSIRDIKDAVEFVSSSTELLSGSNKSYSFKEKSLVEGIIHHIYEDGIIYSN